MKNLKGLEEEYENYMYLASTLTQTHQQTMRNDLINKAESIRDEIFETEKEIREKHRELMRGFK